MSKGMVITARNANGTIRITAEDKLKRTYEWGDRKKTTRLTRRRDRWAGSLGAYDPGGTFFSRTSVITDEGRQFFDSVDEVMRWLYSGSGSMKPVWTPDGLVVGFSRPVDPANGEDWRVGVDVYQIYIDGAKPTDLPGARSDLITITGGDTAACAIANEAPVGYERPMGNQRLVLDGPYDPLDGDE